MYTKKILSDYQDIDYPYNSMYKPLVKPNTQTGDYLGSVYWYQSINCISFCR